MATKTKLAGQIDPVEVTIKHGYFHYHEPHTRTVDGVEQNFWIERIAWCGETVELIRDIDVEKGEEHDAFVKDGEVVNVGEPAEFQNVQDYDDAAPDAEDGDDQ
jgi:hypothetical protein